MRQIIIPRDKDHWLGLRQPNINSTEISALFGISKYATPFEIWNQKKGNYSVTFEGNQRTEWGLALQEAIAIKVAKDQGFNIRPMSEYIYDDEIRLGSSYDFAIDDDGLLEIKNIDFLIFKNEWIEKEDGSLESSLGIELQVQHELLVSGRQYCWLAALVGGNDLKLIKRTPDIKIHDAIKQKAAEFWKSIDENNPPSPNFETDADFINKIYGFSEPGKIIDISDNKRIGELASNYRTLKSTAKEVDIQCDAIKAEILTMIGNAEKCISPEFSISAGMIGPAHISFDRKAYRSFKINFKGKK